MRDKNIQLYLKEISKFPLLTAEQEKTLFKAIKKGSKKAKDELINSNLRLVVKMATKYVQCGMSLSDLIAEGNLGLIEAVDRFKISKKCRFSTYATIWIKHAICQAITEKMAIIRIPAYMRPILQKCQLKSIEIRNRKGNNPTLQEITADLPKSQRATIKEAMITERALNNVQTFEPYHESLMDQRADSVQTAFWKKNDTEEILNFLKSVEPQRLKIIQMRYGLGGYKKMTLQEVATDIGLTKERIRQMEHSTLSLIRQTWYARMSE
ncbi:MAG TPA: sigma-70 family RNA polymerase sigma factor [Planctomycetota bacterium]|nr:sigma-70 family RNA polymerase sigma factor [Planctomycetota bacterium]